MSRMSWQCGDSPTGAHHWVNITGTKIWICQYCGDDTDKFQMGIDEQKTRYGYLPYTVPYGGRMVVVAVDRDEE